MLYLALSCLQGRPMDRAWADLSALEPDGIQLTPGNHVTPGFADHVANQGLAIRTHHGFAWTARRQPVWDESDGRCLVAHDSVHPPRTSHPAAALWPRRAEANPAGYAVETMYPGYRLGNGPELDWAMKHDLSLAVDVSHLHIQRSQGVLEQAVWRRLQDYPAITEVHVSANNGRHDSHRPIESTTFGLDWARARLRAGTPVILECYMHKLGDRQRRAQLDLIRGTLRR